MKHTIYILLFPAVLSGQLALNDQGIFEFQRIVELDSLTEKEIHERSLNWLAETFTSAEDVIHSTTDSKIAGQYIAVYKTGVLQSPYTHRIFLDIKENRVRFTVNNVRPIMTYLLPLEEVADRKTDRAKAQGMKFVNYVGSEIAKVCDGYLLYMNSKEDW